MSKHNLNRIGYEFLIYLLYLVGPLLPCLLGIIELYNETYGLLRIFYEYTNDNSIVCISYQFLQAFHFRKMSTLGDLFKKKIGENRKNTRFSFI